MSKDEDIVSPHGLRVSFSSCYLVFIWCEVDVALIFYLGNSVRGIYFAIGVIFSLKLSRTRICGDIMSLGFNALSDVPVIDG